MLKEEYIEQKLIYNKLILKYALRDAKNLKSDDKRNDLLYAIQMFIGQSLHPKGWSLSKRYKPFGMAH